jgi:hypothetical protein
MAQHSPEYTHTRFHFAEAYMGLGFQSSPAAGKAFYPAATAGNTSSIALQPRFTPRLLIGATHFWGRANFFINIPLTTFTKSNDAGFTTSFNPGIETGALLYPWKLNGHGLHPYVGFSWAAIDYRQTVGNSQKGVSRNLSRIFFKTGLSLQTSLGLWTLGATYMPDHSFSYALSRTQFKNISLSPWSFQLSYKYLFDVTANIHKKSENTKKPSGTNAFAIAIGPSTAFGIRPSSYNKQVRPYLDTPVAIHLFPDLSLGYHFFNFNATLQISYRRKVQSQGGFNTIQHFTRRSISLEAMKFLFDYQGFVPYVGFFVGPEFLKASETNYGEQTLDLKKTKWSGGISVGWDIRPKPAEPIVLRTNLRYDPFLSLKTPDGHKIRFDQLEVDFIQVVIYPQRLFGN